MNNSSVLEKQSCPLVSFLVLTMNRSHELIACLESIFKQEYLSFEVVVVDNASSDDTLKEVESRFPQVRLKALPDNLGAAAGRNKAFEIARGDICVLIDDDAVLPEKGATQKIVDYFNNEPQLGVLSLNVKNFFTNKVDIKSIPRRDKKILTEDYQCTYFCGAGVAFHRKAFELSGGFWGELFIYAEELELSYRILDRGYLIMHCVGIDVLHKESPEARPKDRYYRYSTRNRVWIALRNLPILNALTMSAAWILKNGFASMRSGNFKAFLSGLKEMVLGLRDVWKIRRVLKPETLAILRQYSGRLWF